MKHFAAILIAACLTACFTPTLPPAPPAPQPVVPVEPIPQASSYIIIEFNADGTPINRWEVEDFTETDFPRSVTFTGHACKLITLRGSYEIRENTTTK